VLCYELAGHGQNTIPIRPDFVTVVYFPSGPVGEYLEVLVHGTVDVQ
jgi:hypothetical protein